MNRALVISNAIAVLVLAGCCIMLNTKLSETTKALNGCADKLHASEERLIEVDCSAPLRPGSPFGGMGLYRATHCCACSR